MQGQGKTVGKRTSIRATVPAQADLSPRARIYSLCSVVHTMSAMGLAVLPGAQASRYLSIKCYFTKTTGRREPTTTLGKHILRGCGPRPETNSTPLGVAGSRLFVQCHQRTGRPCPAMAELSPHRTERQALLDKDTPSMAKYNSRVGRARLANQHARNQAHRFDNHSHQPQLRLESDTPLRE